MLDITGLTRSFGPTIVLDDLSISVAEGEMVALLGASGSGKSTLLRHIAGLMTGGRQSGRIAVMGRPFLENGRLHRGSRKARARIGMIFQQFNLVDRLQVRTNVAVGAMARMPLWRTLSGSFPREVHETALASLDRVGILQKAYQRASTLSGGQQQRAAIARALTQRARLILADEPIASLDPESARKVMETLADINRTEGVTVLVSLHQVDYAVHYCPRTIALKNGRIVYDGPSTALTMDFLRSVYGLETETMIGPAGTTAFSSETRSPADDCLSRPASSSCCGSTLEKHAHA